MNVVCAGSMPIGIFDFDQILTVLRTTRRPLCHGHCLSYRHAQTSTATRLARAAFLCISLTMVDLPLIAFPLFLFPRGVSRERHLIECRPLVDEPVNVSATLNRAVSTIGHASPGLNRITVAESSAMMPSRVLIGARRLNSFLKFWLASDGDCYLVKQRIGKIM